MKVPSWGVTFVPLHLGHWILAFSLSEIVMISSKGFSHFSHLNSYLGMTTLVAGSAYSPRRTGSVNVNVDPCPTSLFTQIRPPCSSMNFRERANPRPVPSTFLSAVPT